MEGGKKIVPPPKGLVYSSTIVPPMASEPCLSSTLSAAISSFSSADTILSETQPMINPPSTPQPTSQPLLLPNIPPGKNSIGPVGHAILPVSNSFSNYKEGAELQKGVIYALNHYSPFLSLPRPLDVHLSKMGKDVGHHNKLGPEDVAEVRQMTSAVAATSFHEHARRSEAGKCQSGGELRLRELSNKLNTLHIPEGFVLVGAKSPMLTGMMLVAAVDRRYLPGERDTLTTPGFSGNCVGCGATGFRYFTEFSTHINLKLATQPKKQKHLKCFIVKSEDGKWGRGPLIPWKGTETKKRSHTTNPMPIVQQNDENFQNYQERFPEFQKFPSRISSMATPLSLHPTQEPPTKKQKQERRNNSLPQVAQLPDTQQPLQKSFSSSLNIEETQSQSKSIKFSGTDEDSLESLHRSMSTVCGVRPVLLLCQEISKKLPNSVDDLVVSDLLVGCFDFPDTLVSNVISSDPEYQLDDSAADALREQTAANTLINMGSGTNHSSENKLCFGDKSWPSISARLKEAASRTLPLNASIILFTQYLINLDDSGINRENVELLLNKARIEMSTSTINSLFTHTQTVASTHSQLSLMINLQCSASNGRVRVMTSTISFQNALYKALQWLNETFYLSKVANKKMRTPNFVIILSTPPEGPVEFAVLVTGVSHAKILAESLGINSIVCSDFAESLKKLRNQFSQTDTALNRLIKIHETNQGNKVSTPFDEFPGKKITVIEAEAMIPTQAPNSAKPFYTTAKPFHTKGVFANQAAMAHQLLKQLRNIAENPDILDLASFLHVDICIVTPPITSLYYMTIKRLCESGILNFLGLEQADTTANLKLGNKYVITYSDRPESIDKWTKFVNNIKVRPDTLHLLVFDQAQRYSLPQGMPDVLPNLKEVFESVNVIPVFVTSVPYMFQTNKSFIDPDNEIYWTDTQHGSALSKYTSDDERVMIIDQDMLYFGVKELCDSTRWNQQYSLIRTEETLDWALPKANRLNDINYSTVQGYVLLRLYQASLMVAAGVKPAEPYAVMSFITMVNDIIDSPLHNPDGSGSMLMIRIPNREMSKHFHDVLTKTRNSLGLQYRFDIIHDDGDGELEIGDHFLNRIRSWKIIRGWKQEFVKNWKPKCLEELLDLPCFLILSGEDRSGETLPRSLKYADFNIINQSKFHRSTIEEEIGMCSCYLMVNGTLSNRSSVMNNIRTSCGTTYLNSVKKETDKCNIDHCSDSNQIRGWDNCEACLSKDISKQHMETCTHFSSKYPLPIILISKSLWSMLNSDQGDTRGLVHLNSDPNTRWYRSSRPLLMTTKPDRISRYYRRWTEPRPARKMVTTPAVPSSHPSPGSIIGDECETASEVDQILASPPKREPMERRNSEQIDHEDKDNEDLDKAQYHPRCFLFSGPPQAGKTGSYLYFAYLLHRMLLRLKRVDVYDNCVTYTPASFVNQEISVDVLANWKFMSNFLDMRREKFSHIQICEKENEIHDPILSSQREEGSKQALVILAKTALYDTLHHCDVCKFYREGIASAISKTYTYSLDLTGGVQEENVILKIVIPPIHSKYFDVNEESSTVERLILPQYENSTAASASPSSSSTAIHMVKSPILMMSTVGEEEGLLNMFHGMEETDHVHITFIQESRVAAYQKQWPNHIFACLPDSFTNASDSAVKNIMKTFASQNYSYNEMKCVRDGTGGKTWPFFLFVPDNLVMWQTYWKEPTCYSSDSDEETTEKKERHSNGSVRDSITRDTSSLLEFLTAVETNDQLLQHAIIGVRPWSSFQDEIRIPICVRTFFDDCFLIDVNRTKSIQYSPHVYSAENLDFHLKVLDAGIPTCRLEHFTFMLKVTSSRKWRTRTGLVLGIEPFSSNDVSRFVCQPDADLIQPIEADPHHVFQKYLKYTGLKLFPLANNNPANPVLVIGGYLNLGPEIHLCVVNNGNFQEKNRQIWMLFC